MQLRQEITAPQAALVKKTSSAPAFPSNRYFQIHFEYLHEIIGDLHQHIAETNQRMAQLQQRLDAMAVEVERSAT